MQKSVISYFSILILGVILLLLNAISSSVFDRFYIDLTQERLYTLSDGTKNLLDKLPEVLTIKAYLSKTDAARYPAIKMYGDRIISLLREYERNASGNIRLEIYDPRPDSEEETWAEKFGITPLTMPDGEKLFFGLAVINGAAEEEVLPVFSINRQEFLEYDITRIISALSQETKPVIGLISSIEMKSSAPSFSPMGQASTGEPWVVISQLSKSAEIRTLPKEITEIDQAIKLLMLVHPKNLSASTLYAVDQFVMRGGNLIVMIDPYCNADQPDPQDQANPASAYSHVRSSSLKELLSKWGVEMQEAKVVGDINLATKVGSQRGGAEDFVLWVNLINGQFDVNSTDNKSTVVNNIINRSDVTTSQLNNLIFPWPGSLVNKNVEGVTFETLFQTTPQAMLFEENDYKFGGGMPSTLLKKYRKGDVSHILAARISGKLKSNFDKKPDPDGNTSPGATTTTIKASNEKQHISESIGQANVIVIADVDFITDQASVVQQNFLGTKMVSLINDNLTFAGNITENLLGSSELISLRSRGKFTRPFTKVNEIERQAEEKYKVEEEQFQSAITEANQRLTQLQGGDAKEGEVSPVFNQALLDEVKSLREQRAVAQERLRDVRKNLRVDKERLGQRLFVLNTFAMPLIIIFAIIYLQRRKKI